MLSWGNFSVSLIMVVGKLIDVYSLLILVRALLSWVNPNPYHPLVQLLIRATEPVLAPLRRVIPMSGIDFSPLVAMLLIDIVVKKIVLGVLSALLLA
jgi:YggT family protein